MKKLILLILSLFFLIGTNYPQGGGDHKEIREKIEQLERIKLIESLQMDEQTTLKFFSRRTEFMGKMKGLTEKQDNLLDKLDKTINSSKSKDDTYYQNKLEQYFDIEQKMLEARKSFMTSLSDILTKEQIAKLIVFQKKFREEVRDILFRKGGPHPTDED